MRRRGFYALLIVVLCGLLGCKRVDVYTVPSNAMAPTISRGDIIGVEYEAYKNSRPARFDVVAFAPPFILSNIFVMRIVGLPSERIRVSSEGILINGKQLHLPASLNISALDTNLIPSTNGITQDYKIPSDSYFVLGDNVNLARDSRSWGALASNAIIGRVKVIQRHSATNSPSK